MSEAPERIWAWRNDCGDVWTGEWSDEQDGHTPSDASQYIRADIAERELAEARADTERQKRRGDNHWETLRSIREMAREGDSERITQWVDDAGSGYTASVEATLKSMLDRATAAEAECDNAKSLAEKLICRITELNAERDRLAAEVERLTKEADYRDLNDYWHSFCDADPFEGGDTFAERMEARGLIELVAVTQEALEDGFAAERGIVPGGSMWQLTEAGRASLQTGEQGE